jgi:5-methylcytosine-specific restriction endonuclease McrA
MDANKEQLIDCIITNRRESWCHVPESGWLVVEESVRHPAGRRIVRSAATQQAEEWPESKWSDAVATYNWKSQCRLSPELEAEFICVFKKWGEIKKAETREEREKLEAYRESLDMLMAAIPRYSLADRHRIHLQVHGMRYRGVRSPDENEQVRQHRRARCWNCHRFLDNYQEFECLSCGWILCGCGACGCGQLQHMHQCLACGSVFRETDGHGNYPFCSTTCRVEMLRKYSEYLKTPEWACRRMLRLVLDEHTCQDCRQPASHVHHLTYERLGHEELDDLISLCERCHSIRHGAQILPTQAAKILALLRQREY